jgi:hypothetical protein
VKNQGYQKSTFKFINDEEYERRQNKSTQHERDGSERRIIQETSPDKHNEDSFSDGGNSMKEPQEELAKFAAMDQEKEHSSCP